MPKQAPILTKFEPAYIYKATVLEVHDGDTFTCDIDCGFNMVFRNRQIRMFGINAPELKMPDRKTNNPLGIAAAKYLRDMIAGKEVLLATFKDKTEKYGRLLAAVYIKSDSKTILNVNDEMVKLGHAVVYMTS